MEDKSRPLSEVARPSVWDDVFGQEELVGPNSLLRMLVEEKRVPSVVFWGPPGKYSVAKHTGAPKFGLAERTGKTCLARIIAKAQGGFYRELSAVTDNLPAAKKHIDDALQYRRTHPDSPRPLVFVDEVHRFTKAQQDFFLPGVEKGDYTLLSATTENPSFRINAALLSRCRVFTLSKLTPESIERVVVRGARLKIARVLEGWRCVVGEVDTQGNLMNQTEGLDDEGEAVCSPSGSAETGSTSTTPALGTPTAVASAPPPPTLYLHPTVPTLLSHSSDGDARAALNALDMAVDIVVARYRTEVREGRTWLSVEPAEVREALQKTHLVYDQKGDQHYEVISALHKSMRGGDADAAVYWLGRMLYAGEDPLYIARRLVRFAAEDVGMADPSALPLAIAAWQSAQYLGMPECDAALGECAVYLARANKSVEVYRGMAKGVVGWFSNAIGTSKSTSGVSNGSADLSSSKNSTKKRRLKRQDTMDFDGADDSSGKGRIARGAYSHALPIHTEITFSPFDKDYGSEISGTVSESPKGSPSAEKTSSEATEKSPSEIESEEEAAVAKEHKERAQRRVATGDKLDLKGFWNLSMLLLGVQNLRLIAENYIKYGLLITTQHYEISIGDLACVAICLGLMPLHLLFAVFIEKLALRFTDAHIRRRAVDLATPSNPANYQSNQNGTSNGKQTVSETTPLLYTQSTPATEDLPFTLTVLIPILGYTNALIQIFVPIFIIWNIMFHPAPATIALFFPLILFLKLLSYYWVNEALRTEYLRNSAASAAARVRLASNDAKPPLVPTPPSPNPSRPPVTVSHAFYFWVAPTLCYQISYPRTKRVRRTYVMKRVLEMAVVGLFIWFLIEQYAMPTLKNAMQPMSDLSWPKVFERVLKLSFSSLYIWLGGFYFFFHSFLNFTAELLRFGDRQFYLPWWNSASIGEYWRLWNIPVYTWAKRHVYLPMVLNLGWKPWAAQLVVFLVSAVLHEVVVGIPTHLLYGWAFIAMAGQIPLIWLTQSLQNLRLRWGRIARRASMVGVPRLGRPAADVVDTPLAIMLYYREWNRKYGTGA
ncbi:Werner helicase interacting protein 1 [Gonapodya sp. JEL0774]|nr:Werner helicase interacting protein 1 [Gonapodya sp. JEL0774]